jgi:tartrate-resistant acid phosphatase type 5
MNISVQIHTLIKYADYGWTGWIPSPDNFCFDVLPKLEAAGIAVPNEVINGRLDKL